MELTESKSKPHLQPQAQPQAKLKNGKFGLEVALGLEDDDDDIEVHKGGYGGRGDKIDRYL